MKSAKSTTYLRSFYKLDEFFSYVGGLVGTILGFMFIVANFTNMSYELDLSQKLYHYKDGQPNEFDSFSLLTYGLYLAYSIGKLCGLGKDWHLMQQYDDCREEIAKQLDVQLIMHRLIFLEKSIEVLLEEHQVEGLHIQKRETLALISKRRKRYTNKRKSFKIDSSVEKNTS
jgi:hypothetical protein